MPQQVLGVSGEAGGTFLRSSVYITDCPSIRCLTVKRQTQSIWLMRMVILSCLCWEFLSKCVSHSVLSDSATPWTVACQAPLSMWLSRQEYWSGWPCPPPGDLPKSEIQLSSLVSPELAGGFFTTTATWEACELVILQNLRPLLHACWIKICILTSSPTWFCVQNEVWEVFQWSHQAMCVCFFA